MSPSVRLRRRSFASRLALLMAMPMLAVAWLGWAVVRAPMQSARAADQVAEIAARCDALESLYFRLAVEGLISQGVATGLELGLDIDALAGALGVDLAARLDQIRQATDTALDRAGSILGTDGAVDIDAIEDELVAQRSAIDDGSATRVRLAESFSSSGALLQEAIRLGHPMLEAQIHLAADSDAIEADVHSQADAYALRDAALAELTAMLGLDATEGDRDAMVAAFALFDAALDHVRTEFADSPFWVDFLASTTLSDYLTTRAAMLRTGTDDTPMLRATGFLASLDTLEELAVVADALGAHVVDEAGYLQVAAHDDLRTTGLSIAALAIACVVAGVMLARSVTRPLTRLHEQARALSAGNTDLEPLQVAGPREVADVTRTMNEVVATLQRFSAQASAMASRQLDDPVLAAPLPGALGTTVQRSMDQIAALTERLAWQATRDPLTGLLNRATVPSIITEARQASPDGNVAVLSVDLDGFKELNDRHGHAAGDDALRVLARRFERTLGPRASVARHGGDEFVVVVSECTANGAVEAAERLITAASEPLRIEAGTVSLSASVGVAMARCDDDTVDVPELLRRSDLALYHAKQAGRGRTQCYDAELREVHDQVRSIASALEQSIELGQFSLHLQPIVDARTNRPWGAEALLRWKHPTLGAVPPDQFIPVAERTGQIMAIDAWVIRTACEELARWATDPALSGLVISVNVSGRELRDGDLVTVVSDALRRTGAPAAQLRLELTETYLLGELTEVNRVFSELRNLGVTLALDDFGTGYAALTHLRQLPFDSLKVDRSFIAGLGRTSEDSSIVATLVRLGQMLRLDVVAEGVETAEQWSTLSELGCHRVQGFGVAKPLPIHEARAWLIGRCRTDGLVGV